MAEYIDIPSGELLDFLTTLEFKQIDPKALGRTKEIVYGKRVNRENSNNPVDVTFIPLTVRVYTTLELANSKQRSNGSDAIRVEVFGRGRDKSPRLIKGFKRVHRVKGWRLNLLNRILDAEYFCRNAPVCEQCGNIMAVRSGRQGSKFLGCLSYPACTNTRNIEG